MKKLLTAGSPPSAFVVLLILCVFALLFCGGCAATPASRYAQARDTLTTTQDAIVSQHTAGNITDADFVALDPIVKSARAALERAKTQLPAGGQTFDFYLNLVDDVLKNLATFSNPKHSNKEISYGPAATSGGAGDGALDQGLRRSPGRAASAEGRVHARAA